MSRIQSSMRSDFYAVSEHLLGSAKSSIQGASILLRSQQTKPADKRLQRLERLYRVIEEELTEAEKGLEDSLWDDEAGKNSGWEPHPVQQRPVKRDKVHYFMKTMRPTSPDEVPETPLSHEYKPIRQPTDLSLATPDQQASKARGRYRHPLQYRPRPSPYKTNPFSELTRTPPRRSLTYPGKAVPPQATSSYVQARSAPVQYAVVLLITQTAHFHIDRCNICDVSHLRRRIFTPSQRVYWLCNIGRKRS
ncbi:hypothetical protein NLI96_g6893 [Meripilus lineatus]|uniref:Uncharacterized protein n=1 Tax=Meripilus lineatus TaxID=2056292 RepID=A0AAD5V1X6_9APHY|nr:hypothetical protein NLI96_g6893 [Physisporinus lineatus]